MTAEIIKLPYSATRRLHSRKARRSKNGTPEERAAKAGKVAAAPVTNNSEPVGSTVLAFRRRAEPAQLPAESGPSESRAGMYSEAFFRLPFVTLPTLPEPVPDDWGTFWRVVEMWNETAAAATYKDGQAYALDAVAAICQDGTCTRQLEITVERMLESAFRRRDAKGKPCRGLSVSEKGFLNILCKAAVTEPPKPNPPY